MIGSRCLTQAEAHQSTKETSSNFSAEVVRQKCSEPRSKQAGRHRCPGPAPTLSWPALICQTVAQA